MLAPGDWSWMDNGIKDAMARVQKLLDHVLPEPERSNLGRVLDALNRSRAVLYDGQQLCRAYDNAPTDPHHGGKIWNPEQS